MSGVAHGGVSLSGIEVYWVVTSREHRRPNLTKLVCWGAGMGGLCWVLATTDVQGAWRGSPSSHCSASVGLSSLSVHIQWCVLFDVGSIPRLHQCWLLVCVWGCLQ